MHWIHTAPLLGLAVQATGDDPHTDEPVQVGALSRHGRAAHTPPDMPLAVDLNSQPAQTEITRSWPWPLRRAGRDQGQSLPKVLQRTTQFLLEAAQHGQTVVCVDGHRTLELLERSCQRHGLAPVRLLARRRGWGLRLVDPLLLDLWWDRPRRRGRSFVGACSHHGVQTPQEHMVQQEAASAVELLKAVLDLAQDAHGTLTRLGSGRWEGPRWMELRMCRDADDLHRLSQRWRFARQRLEELEPGRARG